MMCCSKKNSYGRRKVLTIIRPANREATMVTDATGDRVGTGSATGTVVTSVVSSPAIAVVVPGDSGARVGRGLVVRTLSCVTTVRSVL
jgi:hypothetical protein